MSSQPTSQPPDAEWFILIQNRETGPFTLDQMQEKATVGTLRPGSHVRKGQSGWAYAQDYPILVELMRKPPAPDQNTTNQVSLPAQLPEPPSSLPDIPAVISPTGDVSIEAEAAAPAQSTPPKEVGEAAGEGIGGWLSLFALGLSLAPLWTLAALFWDFTLINSRLATDLGINNVAIADFVILCCMLIFQGYVIVVFFQRKREAPALVINLLLAGVLVNLVEWVMLSSATNKQPGIDDFNGVARAIIAAVVWIPYFLVSQRVADTFTVGERNPSRSADAKWPTVQRKSWFKRLVLWLNEPVKPERTSEAWGASEAVVTIGSEPRPSDQSSSSGNSPDNGGDAECPKNEQIASQELPFTPETKTMPETKEMPLPISNESPPSQQRTVDPLAAWSRQMQLNRIQRIVILVGVTVIALMGVFPPWVYTFHGEGGYSSEESAGYRFVAYPPERRVKTVQNSTKEDFRHGVRLDTARLLIQWITVVAVTGVGVLFTSKRREDRNNSQGAVPKT